MKLRKDYKTQKETEFIFLDLYNSGMLLPNIYIYIGEISLGTLRRWITNYKNGGIVTDKLQKITKLITFKRFMLINFSLYFIYL